MAKKRLNDIENNIPLEPEDDLLREGLFVLAISTVEYMLVDVASVFLRAIPLKMKSKDFKVLKEDIASVDGSVLESQIQNYLMNLSYKKIDEFINEFSEHLSINLDGYVKNHGDSLQEIKESRNLLIHNDLRVNSIYIAKAGKNIRSRVLNDKLNIDSRYFLSSLFVLKDFCESCEKEVVLKYESFTKVKAIKGMWEYIFETPILKFDDYWEVDEVGDAVYRNGKEFSNSISSSERMFLGVWLSSFNGSGGEFIKDFNMSVLDDFHKSKMIWFINSLRDFRVY